MDFEEVEKLVNYYEDRIITNFDKYFSELIIMDFYEGGFDGRMSDDWYYEEYFEKHENGIINLMFEIEEDERYYDFQIRLIKLKRIIDNKLLKLINDEGNLPKRQIRINHFILLLDIDKEKFITTLHSKLTSYNFIQCDVNNFKHLFSKEETINKIQWRGTELQITSFVNSLMKYLDSEVHLNKLKLIVNHFINKKGNNFKAKQLGSVYSDKKEFLPDDDPIRTIFEEMSTHS